MRYRDLETGVFLTRDPIGYADGPNIYCYVSCNPITHFDALGLANGLVSITSDISSGDLSAGYTGDINAISKTWMPEMPYYEPRLEDSTGEMIKYSVDKIEPVLDVLAEYVPDGQYMNAGGSVGTFTRGERVEEKEEKGSRLNIQY